MHLDLAVLAVPVQAEEQVAKDLGDVDGRLQRAHNAAVSICQAVLHMIERGVDQHAVVVPCC